MTEKHHGEFLERFRRSHGAVWFMAHRFWEAGLPVIVLPVKESPSYAEYRDYQDGGDLLVKKGDWLSVAVKGLSTDFRDGWPFPEVMVCAAHAWDRADPKPAYFYYVSQHFDAIARLKPDPSVFFLENRADGGMGGRKQPTYCVAPFHLHIRVIE